ncbi:MAG: hypothetical protein J6J86_04360, partial [Lachnospiraceae bacterium]|nr:hypothetical protein [Lachnospiraceae bacterium]
MESDTVATEYDIGAAFKAIEDELMASMIRNVKRHRAEEEKYGFNWEQWQVLQLESLERYKAENEKEYGKRFKKINQEIEVLIAHARDEGGMQEEIRILRAIKNGFLVKATGKAIRKIEMGVDFFKLNERKLNALIEATVNDMKKAETAILRMANDQYRKIIFNAQVYANTGAGTYEKAIDMATRNMLYAGLNCVEYSNGARHTLSDYADMAIRTASKRAYLQGEGQKRQEWGISTVIINKRGNPCPKCLPWVGKILIDDVWSGGKKSDGEYPLMSQAIEAGLYHPRCRDSHTTYFPELSVADDTWTKKELEAVEKKNRDEAKRQYAVRQQEKYERLAKYSLDEENRRQNRKKAETWKEKAGYLIRSNIPGENTIRERQIVNEAMVAVPAKVQKSIHDGTIIDVGQIGASQYDYRHDILYVAKNADKTDVIHEIGHMVENKMLDSAKVGKLKAKYLENVPLENLVQETYYDAAGNPVEIFILKNPDFVSEYQGRLYINDWSEAYDENWNIRPELLMEFISEPFREYIQNPEHMRRNFPEFYELF